MISRRLVPILVVAWVLAMSASAQVPDRGLMRTDAPERRVALVVGNNAYLKAPLRNAVSDANAVSAALREVGFEVTTVTNADLAGFERAIDAFVQKLQPTDIALFFYSGHGMQVGGDNYLIPVDFAGVDEADAKARSYSATRLQEKLEARSRIRLMILDACRDNPFKSSRSGQGGLSEMRGRGSLIAFATSAGSTASDNPKGKNGLFTEQLLEVLRQPGLSSREVFYKVRERVDSASAGKQFPWVSDGLIGDFVFRAGAADNVAVVAAPSAPPIVTAVGRLESRMPAPGAAREVIARAFSAGAGAATSVSISPGSVWLAAGYEKGTVKLWDPRNGKEAASLPGHVGTVGAVAFSPDGRHLATTSGDRIVRLWDFDRQIEEARLVGHTDPVLAVAYSPSGRLIASAGTDMTVRLWDADTAALRDVLSGHRGAVTSVAFTADGNTLVTAGRDRTVRLWNVTRAKENLTLEATSGVLSVAVSRDGQSIAAGSEDGTITTWDAESGQVRGTVAAHKGSVWSVAFSDDGAMLASGGGDALVRTWTAAQLQPVDTYRGHSQWVRSVAFDAAGEWLASAGGDGDVRTWRVTRKR